MEKTMDKIVALSKGRGFVYPGSELYGGLSNSWDYGPLGVELKNNIKKYWWDSMVLLHENIVGLDSAIFMHPTIWKASGACHRRGFSPRPSVSCARVRRHGNALCSTGKACACA